MERTQRGKGRPGEEGSNPTATEGRRLPNQEGETGARKPRAARENWEPPAGTTAQWNQKPQEANRGECKGGQPRTGKETEVGKGGEDAGLPEGLKGEEEARRRDNNRARGDAEDPTRRGSQVERRAERTVGRSKQRRKGGKNGEREEDDRRPRADQGQGTTTMERKKDGCMRRGRRESG